MKKLDFIKISLLALSVATATGCLDQSTDAYKEKSPVVKPTPPVVKPTPPVVKPTPPVVDPAPAVVALLDEEKAAAEGNAEQSLDKLFPQDVIDFENKLKDGESVTLELDYRYDNAYPVKSLGGAGLQIDDYSFVVYSWKKSIDLYVFKDDEPVHRYVIAAHRGVQHKGTQLKLTRNGNTLVISTKNTDTVKFNADTGENSPVKGFHYVESIDVEADFDKPLKALIMPSKGLGVQYVVKDVTLNKDTDFGESLTMIPNLYFKHRLDVTPKEDGPSSAAANLPALKASGPVAKTEIDALVTYLLEDSDPKGNWQNYFFRRRYMSNMAEWLYNHEDVSPDKKGQIVDRAIKLANIAINYRNDNFGKYKVSYGNDAEALAPLWPNFKEIEIHDDGSMKTVPGAGAWGPLNSIAVPVRIISSDITKQAETYEGQIEKFKGKTYKEVALILGKEGLKTVNYVHDTFKAEDGVLRYPDTMQYEIWHNKTFIYNRMLPFTTGSMILAEGLKALDKSAYKDIAKEIHTVNVSFIGWYKTHTTYNNCVETQVQVTPTDENADSLCIIYPYSEAALSRSNPAEDLNHLGFDGRDFQLMVDSERYDMHNTPFVRQLANTLSDVVIDGTTFYDLMDGKNGLKNDKGKISINKNYNYMPALEALVWLAGYREDLQTKLVDYAVSIQEQPSPNGDFEGTVIPNGYLSWELIKLRERLNKVDDNETKE